MSLRPTKPRNMYVTEMEYTLESVNAPQPEPEPEPTYPPPSSQSSAPIENPLPAIPSNQASVMPLPQLPTTPAIPATPPAPKIEIIQGDQITQKAEETIVSPAKASLPVIPSGVEAPVPNQRVGSNNPRASFPVVAEPVSDTALSNSRIAQSFPGNQ